MGIAVRLWTSEDLQKVLEGDRWLTTLLANAKTLSEDSSTVINKVRSKVKEYICTWNDDFESIEAVYATDDEMFWQFIDAEYTERPEAFEVVKTYRTLTNPQKEKVAS